MTDRIAGRFARVEPRRHGRDLVLGLLSNLTAKNCWTLSEQLGHTSPGWLQHLLRKAVWEHSNTEPVAASVLVTFEIRSRGS